MNRESQGISSVVSTIILIAVAIVMAVAIAMYVFDLSGAAATIYGLRVLINGPNYSNDSVVFTIINSGGVVAEIPYLKINDYVLNANNNCMFNPGSSGTLVLIGNGTYIIGARLMVGNCTSTYSGEARLYGINTIVIPFTNGQVFIYSTLQFNS